MDSSRTAWILSSSGLILFVSIPGFALFLAGLVKARNTLSVLFPCFAVATLVSLIWFAFGYSWTFTVGSNLNPLIGGSQRLLLRGLSEAPPYHGVPESVFVAYQMAYAMLAPCLLIGSLVERVRLGPLMILGALWTLTVYIPLTHWIWGGGWLQGIGAIDYAGGLVVHGAGGTAGLTAAWLLGPRRGFPNALSPPHNRTLCAMGAGMVWVGWHGFAPGHTLEMGGEAGMAMLNTHIAGTVASLTWMALDWIRLGKPTLLGIITGLLAGLGMVSAGAGHLSPGGAFITGILASLISQPAIHWIRQRLEIDDALDIFAVHGLTGLVGAITVVFLSWEGLGTGPIALPSPWLHQMGAQLAAACAVLLYSAGLTHGLFLAIDRWMPLRVEADEEMEGLDLTELKSQAYHFDDKR